MRRDERRVLILDRAAGVFAGRGYGGCTMRDVAKACGVVTATLYRHIGSKADLWFQVHQRILEAAVASAEASQMGPNARTRLRAFVTDHIRRVLQRPGEAEVLRGGDAPLPERQRRVLVDLRERYLSIMAASIDDVIRPRTRRKKESRRRAWALLGMADRMAWLSVRGEGPTRPSDLARPVLVLFLEGARRAANPGKRPRG